MASVSLHIIYTVETSLRGSLPFCRVADAIPKCHYLPNRYLFSYRSNRIISSHGRSILSVDRTRPLFNKEQDITSSPPVDKAYHTNATTATSSRHWNSLRSKIEPRLAATKDIDP